MKQDVKTKIFQMHITFSASLDKVNLEMLVGTRAINQIERKYLFGDGIV